MICNKIDQMYIVISSVKGRDEERRTKMPTRDIAGGSARLVVARERHGRVYNTRFMGEGGSMLRARIERVHDVALGVWKYKRSK